MNTQQLKAVNKTACDWFVLMQSGAACAAETQALEHWLAQHAAHREAYASVQALWQNLGVLHNTPELTQLRAPRSTIVEVLLANFRKTCQMLLTFWQSRHWGHLSAGLCVLLLGVFIYWHKSSSVAVDTYSTATGGSQQILLTDGTQITLGAKSQLRAWATSNERHVELNEGQAFFKVAKNPNRPFYVLAGNINIRVLGTQFDVRKGDHTRVAVLEGKVNVSPMDAGGSTPVTLTANQQIVSLDRSHLSPVNSISQVELESWRQGRLIYLRTRLADVIADANRYLGNDIHLDSPQLANLEVTLSVNINEANTLTDMLARSLPIEVHQNAQNIIVLSEKKQ